MAKVTRFEDLMCWQKSRELAKIIYQVTIIAPLSKDYRLVDQLRSAAVPIMSNIAEGLSRYHTREFIRFLDIAQSSASEVKSLLYVVQDQQYLPVNEVRVLQKLTDDCRYLTLGVLKYCSKNLDNKSVQVKEPTAEYSITRDAEFWNLPDEFINIIT